MKTSAFLLTADQSRDLLAVEGELVAALAETAESAADSFERCLLGLG
jgi:hypothetical protein